MKIIEVLAAQWSICYNQKSWQPTLVEAIARLSQEEAKKKSKNNAHSVIELVNHLITWNQVYLDRYEGKESTSIENNDSTFEGLLPNSLDWNVMKAKIIEVFDKWQNILNESKDEDLMKFVLGDPTKGPWGQSISNMILHNSHHIGQIISIRKEHGLWDNKY